MRTFISKKSLLISILLFFNLLVFNSHAQIIAKLDSAAKCLGDTVVVKIRVWNFNAVGIVSLRVMYKTSSLQYLNTQNISPVMYNFACFNNNGRLAITSYNFSGVSLPDDSALLEIRFKYLSDSSYLQFETWQQGSCYFSNIEGQMIPATFVNGVVYNGQPVIANQPTNFNVYQPNPASFSISATGIQASTFSYQWQESSNGGIVWTNLSNAIPFSGVLSPSLNINPVSQTQNGNKYRCKVSSICTSVVSESANLTVYAPLPPGTNIWQIPNGTQCTGNSVNISTNLTNGSSSQYQWYRNGVMIPIEYNSSAIAPTLVISNINTANAGNYHVIVSSAGNSPISSDTLTLSVYNPPIVTVSPTNSSYCNPGSPAITLTATGAATYAWAPANGLSITTGEAVTASPAVTTTYTVTGTDENGCSSLAIANVTVEQNASIVNQPVPLTRYLGQNATFSVGATGNGLTYQWQVSTDSGNSFSNVVENFPFSGSISNSLTISTCQLSMNGNIFRCIVTGCNQSNPAISNAISLNVWDWVIVKVDSLVQCVGDTIVVPVKVWNYRDVKDINFSLLFNNSALQFINYQNSNPNLGVSVCNGIQSLGMIRFASVLYTSSGVSLPDNSTLIEFRFKFLTDSSYLQWETYTVGTCQLNNNNLEVIPTTFVDGYIFNGQSVIANQPTNINVYQPEPASFSVSTIGHQVETFSYQWQESTDGGTTWLDITNTYPYSGALSSTLSISSVNISQNGYQYRCMVTGICIPQLSNSATLTVYPAIPPEINIWQNPSGVPCMGSTVIISTNLTNGSSPTYQWLKNGVAISAVINASAITPNLSTLEPGDYQVVVSATGNSPIFSDILTLTYNALPTVVVSQSLSTTCYPGGPPSILTASGALTYSWSPLLGLSSTTGAVVLASPPSNTLYTVTGTDGNGCMNTANSMINVTLNAEIVTQPVTQTVYKNENTSFSLVASGEGLIYQWQMSSDVGANFTDIIENEPYTGSLTNNLAINACPLTLNGIQFRCIITGCDPSAPVISNTVTLNVLDYIIVKIDSLVHCVGDTFVVPVKVWNFNNVAALSLSLLFEPGSVQYLGTQYVNPNINNSSLVYFCSQATGRYALSSFSSWGSMSVPNGDTLFELRFKYLNDSSYFNWQPGAGSCQISKINGSTIPTYLFNGKVFNGQPVITTQPDNQHASLGSNASFSVSASGPNNTYQWQLSTDNGISWVNLANSPPYNLVTSQSMTIEGAAFSMSGYQFRCKVDGTCLPGAISDPAILAVGDPVRLYCGTTFACPGNNVVVPVTVTQMVNISSFKMTLIYNQTNLVFLNSLNVNSLLSGGTWSSTASGGKITMEWISPSPVTIANGKICDLEFSYSSGNNSLIWDSITPSQLYFRTIAGTNLPSDYVNGTAQNNSAGILTQPFNFLVFQNENAQFTVSSTGNPSYQWQESSNGGITYSNLSNNLNYSGVNTGTLMVLNCQLTMDNFKYRCVISACASMIVSNFAVLHVIIPPIQLSLPAVSGCFGDTVRIPVHTEYFNNVGVMMLTLDYNSSELSYAGFEGLNPALALSGTFTCTLLAGNSIRITWYNWMGVSLGTDNIVNLRFILNASTSTLTWEPSPFCELESPEGNILTSIYTNGTVTGNPKPQSIYVSPPAVTVSPGTTVPLTIWSYSSDTVGFNVTWSPRTNLYEDIQCTIPYTAIPGSHTTTIYSQATTTTTYSAIAHSVFGCTSNSYTTITMGSTSVAFWTGNISDNWNNPDNWFPAVVPGILTDVYISPLPTLPVISTQGNFCHSLWVQNGANVTINPGSDLTATGSTQLEGAQSLVILANAQGMGSFIDNGSITYTAAASVRVDRFIPAYTGNTATYVSSPISDATREVFTGAIGLWEYDGAAGSWVSLPINSTPLNIMKGYVVRFASDQTISFIGHLNTGSQATGTPNHATLNNGGTYGWNLIGNPYSSTIDINAATGWDRGADINPYVVFRKNDGSVGYYSVALSLGFLGGTQFIPPTQAYWINLDGASNITYSSDNQTRVHSIQNVYKSLSEENKILHISATFNDKKDEAIIAFSPLASDLYDRVDIEKMMLDDPNYAMVFTLLSENKKMALNGFSPLQDNKDIPLGYRCLTAGSVTFSINPDQFDQTTAITLEDTELGIIQDLRANPEYSFSTSAETNLDRFILHFEPAKILGQLTYANDYQTPVSNANLKLINDQGIAIAENNTDESGHYQFNKVQTGPLQVAADINLAAGGVNATDALLVLKHFTGLSNLKGIYKLAADVDGSGSINANDALMIQEKFVGLIPDFVPGNWVTEHNPIQISTPGMEIQNNLKALCLGDVNGSFVPLMKNSNNISLVEKGQMNIPQAQECEVPIYLMNDLNLGAVSLVFNLPENIEVKGFRMVFNSGNLVTKITRNQIFITWTDTKGVRLISGQELGYIRLINNGTPGKFSLNPVSELADIEARVINQAVIGLPILKSLTTQTPEVTLNCFPNPATTSCNFIYSVNEDSEVEFTVYTIFGQAIRTLSKNIVTPGTYKTAFEAENLPVGAYVCKMQVKTSTGFVIKTKIFEFVH